MMFVIGYYYSFVIIINCIIVNYLRIAPSVEVITTLYCIVLHCIALHCIALHCIVLYCIVLYCIVHNLSRACWRCSLETCRVFSNRLQYPIANFKGCTLIGKFRFTSLSIMFKVV